MEYLAVNENETPWYTFEIRKHRATGGKLASRYCCPPPGQQVTLRTLIRATGLHRPVEEAFEAAKDDFGLD